MELEDLDGSPAHTEFNMDPGNLLNYFEVNSLFLLPSLVLPSMNSLVPPLVLSSLEFPVSPECPPNLPLPPPLPNLIVSSALPLVLVSPSSHTQLGPCSMVDTLSSSPQHRLGVRIFCLCLQPQSPGLHHSSSHLCRHHETLLTVALVISRPLLLLAPPSFHSPRNILFTLDYVCFCFPRPPPEPPPSSVELSMARGRAFPGGGDLSQACSVFPL